MAWAQSSIYLPDANAPVTNTNQSAMPLQASPAYESRYQVIVSRHRFDNYPVTITDLGFVAKSDFAVTNKTIQVRFSYVQSTTLSSTFAANVGTGVTTVLDAREHRLPLRGATWSRIGLQDSFSYVPALGHLAIEIVVTESTYDSPSNGEFVDAGSSWMFCVSRSYPLNSPEQVGSIQRAVRMQLALGVGEALYLGTGCKGSNGHPPALGIAGRPVLAGSVQVILSNTPANTAALLGFGLDTRPPFPLDLAPVGMPGCRQYFSPFTLHALASDARGTAQTPVPIPNQADLVGKAMVLQHYVLDPPATAAGLTTTNYGRLMVGN